MGYILFDAIGAIWSQFKDAETVLRMATAQRVHISLFHITPHQLLNDMSWLFGAMQQSITGRGNHIIRKYESSQDGIMCCKCFVKKYRYNGNVDVYLAKQQEILTRQFHHNYEGGMQQFLEDYENAFMNIEYVMNKQMKSQSNYNALYTDDGKRSLFIQNFTVPDLTDILIESVESVTDTWYAMVDELRRSIARRMANSVHYSQSNAYNLQKVKHPTT